MGSPFTTSEVCEVAGCTRRFVQLLEESGAVRPVVKSTGGRCKQSRWSVMQTVAIAYAQAFIDAGCDRSWAYAAAAWVAEQEPESLVAEMCQGRTLLSLLPTGEGRLVEPYLKPGASRKHRLMVAQLDLKRTYERIQHRADELATRRLSLRGHTEGD